MKALEGLTEACCNVPPVITKDYPPKGKFEVINGTRTYVTGPPDATTAILYIYDIFGFSNQAIQGADILAQLDENDGKGKYQVFMPDFFDGKPADVSWYPPVEEWQMKLLGEWWSTRQFPWAAAQIPGLIKDFESSNPQIEKWGVVGFCWGAKVIALTAQSDTLYTVAACSSPARMDPLDAAKITIPICLLTSEEESEKEIGEFVDALDVEHYVEKFQEQKHGWMTARGDLEDEKVRKAYERGYGLMVSFLGRYLD